MQDFTTNTEQETRRRIAGRLLLEGGTLQKVADIVGASVSSVKRWKKAVLTGGMEALATRSRSGRPPRLTPPDKQRLIEILLAGPLSAGYRTELWTCKRVAQVIEKHFGVRYHDRYPWQIVHRLGFTCQLPEQRAREQDPEAVCRWRRYKWPRLKRGHAKIS
jgi:putative transposase